MLLSTRSIYFFKKKDIYLKNKKLYKDIVINLKENIMTDTTDESKSEWNRLYNAHKTPTELAELLDNALNEKKAFLIKELVDQGADVNMLSSRNFTPLFAAIRARDFSLFKYLVEEKGADVNKTDRYSLTVLMFACIMNVMDIVKYLVEEKNVDLSKVDDEGQTAFFLACKSRSLDIVRYLVGKGA